MTARENSGKRSALCWSGGSEAPSTECLSSCCSYESHCCFFSKAQRSPKPSLLTVHPTHRSSYFMPFLAWSLTGRRTVRVPSELGLSATDRRVVSVPSTSLARVALRLRQQGFGKLHGLWRGAKRELKVSYRVKGEPGVVRVPQGSRLADLCTALTHAKGLAEENTCVVIEGDSPSELPTLMPGRHPSMILDSPTLSMWDWVDSNEVAILVRMDGRAVCRARLMASSPCYLMVHVLLQWRGWSVTTPACLRLNGKIVDKGATFLNDGVYDFERVEAGSA